MTSVEQKIHDANATNKELLALLAETDYAPPALKQQNLYISDLKSEVQKLDKEIAKLDAARKKEQKEHESYRDSVMKRFAYKVTRKQDKFEARASKEEKEYFAALQAEHRAKEALASTQKALDEASHHKTELDQTAKRHTEAQRHLDELYNSIFNGPTPGFPEEDAREQSTQGALQVYQDTRTKYEAETQALNILSQALQRMKAAQGAMAEARSHSRMDMFGGGTMSDMMERSALHNADQQTMEAQMLIMQAQRLTPHVASVNRPTIAQGNLMSDVFFDNIFTDMDFHEKIKASELEVQKAAKAVEAQVVDTKTRLEQLKKELASNEKTLDDARQALQKAREQAFERVSGGGNNSNSTTSMAPPPVYQA